MKVVTADMRAVRRLRRDAERAARGAPPRRRFGPRPSGLLAVGWTSARDTADSRLLGAAPPGVSIAGRACVVTAARTVDVATLGLPPVVVGPMPANPLPLQYAVAVAAAAPVAPEVAPVAEAIAEPSTADPLPAAQPAAAQPGPSTSVPPAVEVPVPAQPSSTADLPPGPWSADAPAPAAPPPAAPPPAAAVAPTPAAAPPSRAAAAFAGPSRPSVRSVPSPPSGYSSPREPSPPREPMPSDLFAHALGLSPANTPPPLRTSFPDPPPPPRSWRRFRDRPPREPGRGRLWLAAAGVVVLAGAGTAVGFAVAGGSPDDSPTTSATSAALASTGKIGAWLSANVTTDQRIVATDPDLARALNANGVPVDTSTADVEQRAGVVVVTTDAGAQPPSVTAEGASRSLVTLAVFGTGADTVAVGQVVEGSAESVRADLTTSATTAMAACKGLAANAAVKIGGDVDSLFEAGRLDLRTSTFLALIAQDQPITVVSVPQDPAESAADRPVRMVVVSVQDPAAVRDSAATARAPYAPEVETPGSGVDAPAGSLVLSWPVDATATLPVN